MKLRSASEVKNEFERKGISARSWALANGFKPFVVYQLLNGLTRGGRGDSHRAAVLLGMKEGEIASAHDLRGPLHQTDQRRAA